MHCKIPVCCRFGTRMNLLDCVSPSCEALCNLSNQIKTKIENCKLDMAVVLFTEYSLLYEMVINLKYHSLCRSLHAICYCPVIRFMNKFFLLGSAVFVDLVQILLCQLLLLQVIVLVYLLLLESKFVAFMSHILVHIRNKRIRKKLIADVVIEK